MYDDIYYIYIHTYIHVLYQRYSSIYIYMYDVYICEKYIAPCRLDEIRVIPVWPLLICFQSDNLYVLLLWFSNFVVMDLLSTLRSSSKHVFLNQNQNSASLPSYHWMRTVKSSKHIHLVALGVPLVDADSDGNDSNLVVPSWTQQPMGQAFKAKLYACIR